MDERKDCRHQVNRVWCRHEMNAMRGTDVRGTERAQAHTQRAGLTRRMGIVQVDVNRSCRLGKD